MPILFSISVSVRGVFKDLFLHLFFSLCIIFNFAHVSESFVQVDLPMEVANRRLSRHALILASQEKERL